MKLVRAYPRHVLMLKFPFLWRRALRCQRSTGLRRLAAPACMRLESASPSIKRCDPKYRVQRKRGKMKIQKWFSSFFLKTGVLEPGDFQF